MNLRWKPAAPHYQETACNRYCVSGARVNGALKYTAWRQGRPPLQLGIADTADECKALCETDAGDSVGRKPE